MTNRGGRPPTGAVLERHRAGGDISFALRFTVRGAGRQYVTLGRASDGWTRADAEAELAATLRLVASGTFAPAADNDNGPYARAYRESVLPYLDAIQGHLRDVVDQAVDAAAVDERASDLTRAVYDLEDQVVRLRLAAWDEVRQKGLA